MTTSQLVAWATSNGALVSNKVAFKEVSQGNIGAFYSSKGSENDALKGNQIRLPLNLVITVENAIEAFGEEFHAISSTLTNTNSLLKLYLARERTSEHLCKSFFKPYLDLLPSSTQIGSPLVWTADEKALLKGSNLGNSLKDNIRELAEEWWQIINLLPESLARPSEHFVNMKFYYEYKFYTDDDLYNYLVKDLKIDNWTSFSNYLWASLIIKSRAFPRYLLKSFSDSEIKEHETMLLPLIDLLNHDPTAKVNWSVNKHTTTEYFDFKSDSASDGELFNNYGQKGNEELLLGYGFCLEHNAADSTALKIKVPLELLPDLELKGVKLPKLSDYTTSIVEGTSKTEDSKDYKEYEEGLLFFITTSTLPENLILLFQWLVRTKWEDKLTLRMKLAGFNYLRQAIESKSDIVNAIKVPTSNYGNSRNTAIYLKSQQKIFSSAVKMIKRKEKEALSDPEYKLHLLSLKNVYKKDIKFQQSLLVTLGVTSFEGLADAQLQDQVWLLYLIRCFNRDHYIKSPEDEEDNYLPVWIQEAFVRMAKETTIDASEIVSFKDIYQGLIPPLNEAVPEIYNVGEWGVNELIISAKLLDTISFVRGKEQECILVQHHEL